MSSRPDPNLSTSADSLGGCAFLAGANHHPMINRQQFGNTPYEPNQLDAVLHSKIQRHSPPSNGFFGVLLPNLAVPSPHPSPQMVGSG
jgi:hypothetical protein